MFKGVCTSTTNLTPPMNRFVSDLVGNPDDRFCCDKARMFLMDRLVFAFVILNLVALMYN